MATVGLPVMPGGGDKETSDMATPIDGKKVKRVRPRITRSRPVAALVRVINCSRMMSPGSAMNRKVAMVRAIQAKASTE